MGGVKSLNSKLFTSKGRESGTCRGLMEYTIGI